MAPPAHADADLTAYVRARAADARGDAALAARGYAEALAASGSPVVAIRAYREGLQTGDMALVRRAVGILDAADAAPADSALVVFADAVGRDDAKATDAALVRLSAGPFDFLLPTLKAWRALDAGADPFAPLDDTGKDLLARRYASENRALLLLATGKYDEGVLAIRAASAAQNEFDLRWAAAELLLGRGRRERAMAMLAGDDAILVALRERPGKGARPSLAFGASRLFVRLATDVMTDRPGPFATVLLRSALAMAPGNDRARILLAVSLAAERGAGPALAALDGVDPDGAFAESARTTRIGVLSNAGDDDAALAAAEALTAGTRPDPGALRDHGDLLYQRGRFAEAADTYIRALALPGAAPSWQLELQLGGALDRAGRWTDAKPHLERAISLSEGEAGPLNYLGYALLERGEERKRARELIERAAKLRPADAAITDSLAWAYFLDGEVARALPLLERAAAAEPADPTINEHLGDAYWSAGRRYEARYAWQAAALGANGGEAKRLAAKIADGVR